MTPVRNAVALLAAGMLIVAACAADPAGREPGWTPGVDQTPTEQPGTETPATGVGESPEPGVGESPEPGVGESPEPGTETPDPGTGAGEQPTPEPGTGTGEQPILGAVQALAVVDHGGNLIVMSDGECSWDGGGTGQAVAGQPGDGSTLQLTFGQDGVGEPGTGVGATPAPGTEPQPGAGQDGSLQMSIQLVRGFPQPAEPEPGPASPAPGQTTPRPFTGEDILPFTILSDQVQISLQLAGQDVGQPWVMTGTVAPNGLSGYVVSQTEDRQLLTINFICAQGAQDVGPATPGAGETPAPAESPAIESPTPSPAP